MNPLKDGTVTELVGDDTVKTHDANPSRQTFMISNRPTNTLTAYFSIGSTAPVVGGKCSFSLAPGGVYEWPYPNLPYTGPIKYILNGAGPENLDITELS